MAENEYEVFYRAWRHNHPNENRTLINAYMFYDRFLYLKPDVSHKVFEIQSSFGEPTIKLITPFIKQIAKENNIRLGHNVYDL